jgi:hypothetical protein
MFEHSYAREKLTNAVYYMAIGRGPIKDRLFDAFVEMVALSDRDFPDPLKEDYRWIRSELTRKEAKQRAVVDGWVVERVEGRLGATLRTMRIEKAQEIARRIYELAAKLEAADDAA